MLLFKGACRRVTVAVIRFNITGLIYYVSIGVQSFVRHKSMKNYGNILGLTGSVD